MRYYLAYILLFVSSVCFGQSRTYIGNRTELNTRFGGYQVEGYFRAPRSFQSFPKYDSMGMIWFDSAVTKQYYYHNGTLRLPMGGSGGSGITAITQGRGVILTPNPIVSIGSAAVDTTDITTRFYLFANYYTQAQTANLVNVRKLISDSVNIDGYTTRRQTASDIADSAVRKVSKIDSNINGSYITPTFYYANLPSSTTIYAGTNLLRTVDTFYLDTSANHAATKTDLAAYKPAADSAGATGYSSNYGRDTASANNRANTAASISGLVPYFGATSQVNLGQYNIRANNHFDSSMVTVSAGTTTTLTIASPRNQAISGSLSQTFLLPDATTMPKGPSFAFNNNSSGSLIIANAGGTTLYTVPAGGLVQGGATNTATANGAWDFHAIAPTTVTWGSGATGLVFNSVLSTTPSIDAGASSSTNPSFRPQRGSTTTGYGGDGSNLYMILGGASKFSVNSSGHTTVEGVTSTGATGTGNIVYSISPALTGSPTAPTQTAGTSNTTIATTAFVAAGFAVANTDTTISANYTLTALDNRRTIHCTNGSNINLTIPTGLAVTFKCDVFQEGAGNVVFVASGTTLNFVPNATTKTLKLGAGVYIGSFATANNFTVQGALQP